jgi:hypothetical protein
MLTVLTILFAAVAALALVLAVRTLAGNYRRFRGKRVVSCPETHEFAAVEVDAKHAAVTALYRERELRLEDCSRWPEKENCGQECLAQIEAAPMECLARNLLTRWYAGSTCAVCGKAIGTIDWYAHKPALMSPERRTVSWNEVRAERLPEVLATHFPVCWDCHVVESVVRKHADRVVVRPSHRGAGIPGPMPADVGPPEPGREPRAR